VIDEARITLFMTDEAEHLTSLWDSHDEALALHNFHSFVLMHILGDNSDLFGGDNDDHRHSLIGSVMQPNVVDVINWRPLEAPGTRSHTIL
jgi:hypothetical protein